MKYKIPLLGTLMMGEMLLATYFMKKKEKQIGDLHWQINKFIDHFQLLNHWLELKNDGKSLVTYFEDMGYQHIAIYGMAELGNRLCEELSNSSICIDYGIDRDVCCCMARIAQVYFPEDELPEVDAIIVTPYSVFEEIRSVLKKNVKCPIISLEDVVWSM